MKIRKYLETDYPALLPLIIDFKNEESSYDTDKYTIGLGGSKVGREYFDQILKDLREKNGYLFLAKEKEEILGFIMGIVGDFGEDDVYARLTHREHKVGWIGIVFVSPENRGRGFAKQLIEKAKEYLKSEGCQVVKLNALVSNPAVKVYKKLGFRSNSAEMIFDL